MSLRFNGEYDELKRIVDSLKFTGEWSESENPTCVQFRTKDGAILNWFPTTGTINFQGPDPAKSRVASKVRIAPPFPGP